MRNKNWKNICVLTGFLLALFVTEGPLSGKKERAQIILISVDTLRADHLTAYGYARDTSPQIKKLADESVLYEHAYPAGCWTMPSHMSMLTGTLPSRHGVNMDWSTFEYHLKEDPVLKNSIKTIAEILKEAGFHTAKIAKLPDEIGFSRAFETSLSVDPFQNEAQFQILLNQLENNKNGDFFFFIHTWMVHAPYSDSHFVAPAS